MSGNTLDLVLSANPGKVQDVEMIGRIGSSYHETLIVHLRSDVVSRSELEMSRAWSRANFDEMRRELRVDWEAAMSGMEWKTCWS